MMSVLSVHRILADGFEALLAQLDAGDWPVATGFLGAGMLMPVLSKAGCHLVAVLEQLHERERIGTCLDEFIQPRCLWCGRRVD